MLHHHHTGEDELAWPKLLERGGADVAPLVATMERQHGVIDSALHEVTARLAEWRQAPSTATTEALAGAVDAMLPPLVEHTDTEELHLLTLIDRHLTADEWGELAKAAQANAAPKTIPMTMGMALYEAGPEQWQHLRETLPGPLWFLLSRLGPRSYAKYARRIHGTPTPARSTR